MTDITIVGVDPGLVNTGCVALTFDVMARKLYVRYRTIDGGDHADQALQWVKDLPVANTPRVFVESYRERGNSFSTDTPMRELLAEFRRLMPKATILDNTGVKKVVRKPLLQVFNLWQFPTTHHQDLQAAARILMYGTLKDEALNRHVTEVLLDHIDGQSWPIHKEAT